MGYDGKGQWILRTAEDVAKAKSELPAVTLILDRSLLYGWLDQQGWNAIKSKLSADVAGLGVPAALIAKEPIALQLRYLQTMREMASEHNTTTFLPLPIDLFSAFLKK